MTKILARYWFQHVSYQLEASMSRGLLRTMEGSHVFSQMID